MTAIALIFTFSAIGISETVYLIQKRTAHEKPVCPIGEGCEVVLTSKYSNIFLVPNDLLGLFAYIFIAIISALLILDINTKFFDVILNILIVSGSLVSIFFTYLQWKVIKTWCFWCLMSASTMWLMGVIILASNSI